MRIGQEFDAVGFFAFVFGDERGVEFIELREGLGDHRPAGIDEVGQGVVGGEHGLEEDGGLEPDITLKLGAFGVLREDGGVGDEFAAEFASAQPLGDEAVDEVHGFRTGEEAGGFFFEGVGVVEFVSRGGFEELVVGHATE